MTDLYAGNRGTQGCGPVLLKMGWKSDIISTRFDETALRHSVRSDLVKAILIACLSTLFRQCYRLIFWLTQVHNPFRQGNILIGPVIAQSDGHVRLNSGVQMSQSGLAIMRWVSCTYTDLGSIPI